MLAHERSALMWAQIQALQDVLWLDRYARARAQKAALGARARRRIKWLIRALERERARQIPAAPSDGRISTAFPEMKANHVG